MIKRKCSICGRDFLTKKSHIKRGWGKYCSKKCQAKSQIKGKWINCDYCGDKVWRTPKDFKRSKTKKFFCSVKCHCAWENKNRRCGENAPNWVAGQTVYRQLMKRHGKPEKCVLCGYKNKKALVVHHQDSNRKNNKLTNLIWLCRNCHYLVHYD